MSTAMRTRIMYYQATNINPVSLLLMLPVNWSSEFLVGAVMLTAWDFSSSSRWIRTLVSMLRTNSFDLGFRYENDY